jgi:hypothetical protein
MCFQSRSFDCAARDEAASGIALDDVVWEPNFFFAGSVIAAERSESVSRLFGAELQVGVVAAEQVAESFDD